MDMPSFTEPRGPKSSNQTKTKLATELSVKTDDDIRPDSWQRFRRAVHAAAESGPMHKVAPPQADKKARPASKGRVHKGKTGR